MQFQTKRLVYFFLLEERLWCQVSFTLKTVVFNMQGRTAKKVKLTVATEKKNDGIQASLAKALTTSCCSFSTFPWVHKEKTHNNAVQFFCSCSHLSSPVVKISCKNNLPADGKDLQLCHLQIIFYFTLVNSIWTAAEARTTFFPDEDWDLGHKLKCQIFSFVRVKQMQIKISNT